MADELVDILTENGSPLGEIKLKSEAHKKGLWHASAQIWLYTPQGEILIQQRASCKDTYPNLWDISVAGHLSAGDTPVFAAIREIKEEIGISISAEALQFLKTIKRSKQPKPEMLDNEFNHLFICCFPIKLKKLQLQVEEVAAVQLISLKNFKEALNQNPKNFVPHGKEYYQYIINCIETTLNAKEK